MPLQNNIESLLKYIEQNRGFTEYSEQIFQILEGNLITKLFKTIDEQLSNKSAQIMKSRAIPLNVLKKIIDKLSKLYFEAPERTTENPVNQELIDYYTQEANVNIHMGNCNNSFNAYKNTSMEIVENADKRKIEVRSIPSHQFLVWSNNDFNPLEVTGYIKYMGTIDDGQGRRRNKFWAYTDEEFLSFDSDKNVVREDMQENAGVNPFGIIPFSYLTRSNYMLIPEVDTDTLRMATMIPLLLSETSFASMFLANPIIYGVDLDIENLNLSPSVFWDFKSSVDGREPKIGVIKPDLDMTQQIEYTKDLLSLWLETRNIRAGALGKMDADNAASGIALAIREMDTTQDRVNQEKHFKMFESDFWRRLAIIHNTLASAGRLEERRKFVDPENMDVYVEYADQKPIIDDQTKIANVLTLMQAGLISRRMAIKRINEDFDDDDVEQLLNELDSEETIGSQMAEVQDRDSEGV